ncbi:hypothetical protein BCR41DRAFT_346481 [Lobosporangium transversale]|uniref:Myb-like domain-containing protein n=1 Tax=Lobosporangium transversale TaxID=64571 RepID=A0A1Y2GY58_9FUNG|nr:hypothetical protein BCR41DRAFT_346481 [Lobosporangium transversale]ORZ27195.1 hypothetical protein BCR41DRAFT_346481 [Lobosporangium transversale]|eukprot:XP_021884922.1 hypothetical protein BCR41DRAFT_346481 [Lobosporangium transversale]
MLSKVHHRSLPKHQQLRIELQKRHEESQRQLNERSQLQIAYQEFHRQREQYQREQQQQQRHLQLQQLHQLQQQRQLQARPPSSAASTNSTMTGAWSYTSSSPLSSSSSSSSSSTLSPSANHSPFRHSQYSDWSTIREKERARMLANIASIRDTLPSVPPPQVAKENLRRLSERLQHRRARTRETILYDIHQGVKSVEAEVHRQVELVLSRLKEAPGSRYAFALTNSFLSQIPSSLSNTLLPTANILPTPPPSSDSSSSSSPLSPSAYTPAFLDDDKKPLKRRYDQDGNEDIWSRQQQERDRMEADSLSNEFDSIALAGSAHATDTESEHHAQEPRQQQLSISSSGASEVLSASMHTSYTTACSRVLDAALPSFIPSMVAPLVCVFSYPAPSSSAQANQGTAEQQHQQQKEFVFPWGLPDQPRNFSQHSKQGSVPSRVATPDPGIIVVDSKSWTQAEREALYLAATRFRLCGQWSKIREMMNLHRTDQEIETEYMKLYGHRDDDIDDDDDDEGEEKIHIIHGGNSGQDSDHDEPMHMHEDGKVKKDGRNQMESMDGDADADDEGEGERAVFMKFGGSRRHHQGQNQSQSQSQSQNQSQGPDEEQSQMELHRLSVQPPRIVRVGGEIVPSGYEQQPIVDPRQREPIRLHKKELLIDKRFTLEEIPMRI